MTGKRELGGQVTVFVSMIMMILFAFLCVLLESARTARRKMVSADGGIFCNGFGIQPVSQRALG